jgi:prophage antirepressor-like protein
MEIEKIFKSNDCNYNITIKGTIKNPLFDAKQIGEILEIKQVRNTIKDFDETEKVLIVTQTNGGPQNKIFLTKQGVFNLIMISIKPNAKKFKKWIFEVIDEIWETGKYEVKNTNEFDKIIMEKKKHNANIIELSENKKLVYIMQLEEQTKKINKDGYTIYKIGHTDNIKTRIDGITREFGTSYLCHVFNCNNNNAFERFIHNHKDIKCYFMEVIEGKKETYCLNEEEYTKVINIIKANVHVFRGFSHEQDIEIAKIRMKELKLENEKEQREHEKEQREHENEKIELFKKYADNPEGIKILKSMFGNITEDIKEEVNVNPVQEPQIKYVIPEQEVRAKQTKTSKIQKYDAITLKLIATYPSYIEAIRNALEDKTITMSSSVLKNNIKNNWMYKGFRWWEIDHDAEEIEYKIPPTEDKEGGNKTKDDYICMLNLEKTKIMEVFSTIKAAGIKEMVSPSSIANAIRRDSKSCNKYWIAWSNVSEELKNKYLESNTLPERDCSHNCIRIKQINPITNEVVKIFNNIQEVQKTMQCSRLTLKNAINSQNTMKHFKWSYE